MEHRILIADDEENIRFVLRKALEKEGYKIDEAQDGIEALNKIRRNLYDLALVDIKMPKMDGFTLIEKIMKIRPYLTIIVITAYGSKEITQKVVEMGVYDYFNKPVDLVELRIVVKRALQKVKMERELLQLKEDISEKYEYTEIIATSPKMKKVFDILNKIVDKDVTVLITGESGTGKELIARAIHYNSKRKDRPFIKMNCAAIPETLLESELFGYEKGAFTGADKRKVGKFEMANGGTIFLDEIGDMPLSTQAKILRVLQEREIERIGGYDSIFVDIRVIAATNQNLEKKVAEKKFREDLYFRLNVIKIELPPLRERKEDIPLLVEHFLKIYSKKFGKDVKKVSPEVIKYLMEYKWPGNIRELENVIQRAVVLANKDEITVDLLPQNILLNESFTSGEPSIFNFDWNKTLPEQIDKVIAHYEKKFLTEALIKFKGTKEELAEKLGISRKNLYNKLNKYNLL